MAISRFRLHGVVALSMVLGCGGGGSGSGSDGDSDSATSGATTGEESSGDETSGATTGVEACGGQGTISCLSDPASGLQWEIWQTTPFCDHIDAINHCDSLIACGQDDWRLPTVDDLRTLVRGCAGTQTGGACKVVDGSGPEDYDSDCWCDNFQGPGPAGCYWDAELGDKCGDGGWGFWSTSQATTLPNWWSVSYYDGRTLPHAEDQGLYVRCVRDG